MGESARRVTDNPGIDRREVIMGRGKVIAVVGELEKVRQRFGDASIFCETTGELWSIMAYYASKGGTPGKSGAAQPTGCSRLLTFP